MPTYVKEIKPVDKMVSGYPFLFFNYFFFQQTINKKTTTNKQKAKTKKIKK